MNWEEWKFSLEVAWDDPWYRWQSIATVAAVLGGSAFFLWRMAPVGVRTGLLVFHYNLYFGIDEVLPWMWIFVFPGALIVMVVIDLLASGHLFRKDRIVSRVLLCTATVFTIFALIGGFFLTTVNG
ncbi:hypothetical protein A3E39_03095 [Candidatus Uhrbacteria bacterium RIFCSPHIGHO2_12_FULL_60_25]|uniref:Uncharacterized protein n=1 Tax=Candidatus Uhrbacteria bacterium RIFCSPHIGHO2_12_FULL_60_25 TaxID=1802399 RepID=A0A1F7UIW4_9BACT|nr:MAG: hypothetical protein A3E39_03095 [Candidatus Uhrbacteria bacterium RIFCSPHIGHO2_12_FULL_60_25]